MNDQTWDSTFRELFPFSAPRALSPANSFESLRYGTSNLYLIHSNQAARHEQAELLENHRLRIEKSRQAVDWIILDGSSVMRNFSDLAPLLPLATDLLLVHDQSRRGQERSAAALNLLRPRLAPSVHCGVVMNRCAYRGA